MEFTRIARATAPTGSRNYKLQRHQETSGKMIRRTILGCMAVSLLSLAGFTLGASRSEIADAVQKGDKTAVRTLLQRKADVNAAQVDGATALHWAVYRDDLETADLLIRAGATVKAKNREGISPLYLASQYGGAAMIDRLLKSGADV